MDKQSLILIAMELDLPSLLNFCKSGKFINDSVCKNKYFWINKLKRDYNFVFTNNSDNPREYYKLLYKAENKPGTSLETAVSSGYTDLVDYLLKNKDIKPAYLSYIIKETDDVDMLDILIPKLINMDPHFNIYELEEYTKDDKKLFKRYKKYVIQKYFKQLLDAIDENDEATIQNLVDNNLYDFEIYLDYDKDNILNYIKDHYREYF